ncbi:MAG: PIG-L family deacetylase [Bacteroidota bacterium]
MRLLILLVISNIILEANSYGQGKTKTILAIFAHTDDESAIGQVLSKYSKQAKVYIIYVAEDIDTSKLDITPAGDSINHLKIADAKCACINLNVQPIFLGMGRLIYDPIKKPRDYYIKTKKLKSVLQQKIKELKPDAIITFGPDGDSGHPEHRIVSSIITEIILYNGWVERYPLYYAGWPKEKNPIDQIQGTGEVDKKYLTVEIHFSEKDKAIAFEAFTCYKNQFSTQQIQERKDEDAADKLNVFYFRQLIVSNKRKTDLFVK